MRGAVCGEREREKGRDAEGEEEGRTTAERRKGGVNTRSDADREEVRGGADGERRGAGGRRKKAGKEKPDVKHAEE